MEILSLYIVFVHMYAPCFISLHLCIPLYTCSSHATPTQYPGLKSAAVSVAYAAENELEETHDAALSGNVSQDAMLPPANNLVASSAAAPSNGAAALHVQVVIGTSSSGLGPPSYKEERVPLWSQVGRSPGGAQLRMGTSLDYNSVKLTQGSSDSNQLRL